jgi:hypothetical protein
VEKREGVERKAKEGQGGYPGRTSQTEGKATAANDTNVRSIHPIRFPHSAKPASLPTIRNCRSHPHPQPYIQLTPHFYQHRQHQQLHRHRRSPNITRQKKNMDPSLLALSFSSDSESEPDNGRAAKLHQTEAQFQTQKASWRPTVYPQRTSSVEVSAPSSTAGGGRGGS